MRVEPFVSYDVSYVVFLVEIEKVPCSQISSYEARSGWCALMISLMEGMMPCVIF